jgi:hypothetical protein
LMLLHGVSLCVHAGQVEKRETLPSFEVATVKPNHTGDGSTHVWRRDGRYTIENLTLKQIIMIAYALQSDAQISGGIDTLLAQHYDIDAKVDDQQEASIAKMSPEDQRGQMALMLQFFANTEIYSECPLARERAAGLRSCCREGRSEV